MKNIRVVPCGDGAVSVRFEEEISLAVHEKVMALDRALEGRPIPGTGERVPSYCALLITYNPMETDFETVCRSLLALDGEETGKTGLPACEFGKPVELPVCYGGEFGPDLADVAKHAGLTEEEAVAIHAGGEYPVYLLGFTPGFPYLGGMDKRIATPRLAAPRTRVEAGSVGIAGAQTGVYPVASPGGWRIIGRTPAKLYDPGRQQPFLLQAGQVLRFRPITKEEYFAWEGGNPHD